MENLISNNISIILTILITIGAFFGYIEKVEGKKFKLSSFLVLICTLIIIWISYFYNLDKTKKLQTDLSAMNKRIENSNNLNKQHRIDLLKQMKIEMEYNLHFARGLIELKDMFLDVESSTVTAQRFSVASIDNNISEATLDDDVLKGNLIILNNDFKVINKMLNGNRTIKSSAVRVRNMRKIYRKLEKTTPVVIATFCNQLEEDIKKLEKENK